MLMVVEMAAVVALSVAIGVRGPLPPPFFSIFF